MGAPGDGDVVSGAFADAVQVFRRDGLGLVVGLDECVGEGLAGGEGVFDVNVGDHSGAGDPRDADGCGTSVHQLVLQSLQAFAFRPRPGGRGGQ